MLLTGIDTNVFIAFDNIVSNPKIVSVFPIYITYLRPTVENHVPYGQLCMKCLQISILVLFIISLELFSPKSVDNRNGK